MKKINNISIIIINKNDRGIADTLSVLVKINSPIAYEIIVVDASSGKLDDIKRKFPSVKWYEFRPIKTKKNTRAEQRNVGIRKSKGEIIIFIDANCAPVNNWLTKLISPIIENDEKIVAGRVVSKHKPTIHDRPIEVNINSVYLHDCPTINLAFVKEVYDVVGKFDDKLSGGEDIDFSWRAVDSGYKIRYIPEALIAHDWGKFSEEAKRAYSYGMAKARLYKKHSSRRKSIFKYDLVVIAYPVYLLGLPITIFFWPYPMLILLPFFKNLKFHPFKTIGFNTVVAVGVLRGVIRK